MLGSLFGADKYKDKAEYYANLAQDVQEEQNAVDFRRGILANIRENRMANAMISFGNYSDDYTSSSVAGAKANVNSALAGDTRYSIESSNRMQKIQNYSEAAESWYEAYQKKQQNVAIGTSIIGMAIGGAAGAMTGGFGLGLSSLGGGLVGAQAGQGLGQILSDTGQEEIGISNLIGAGATAYRFDTAIGVANEYDKMTKTYQQYLAKRNIETMLGTIDEDSLRVVQMTKGKGY